MGQPGSESSGPEGPEIRRAADRVAAAIAGHVAEDVFFAFERLEPYARDLTGRRVEQVTSRGKSMLTRFEGGLSVYSHNQLYGRWYVMNGDRMPKTRRQLRFAVTAGGKRALLYSASEIEVLDRAAERTHPYLSRLGPDVLSTGPTTRRAYRTGGITLPPALVKELKAAGARRWAYRFWVYRRAGKPCRVCATPLTFEIVGGRKCFFCPVCQPAVANRS